MGGPILPTLANEFPLATPAEDLAIIRRGAFARADRSSQTHRDANHHGHPAHTVVRGFRKAATLPAVRA
ncbi:hypothetical protein RRSWK_05661 [Rhodopirellula sp. SWK7]|nr:hypothetical protein RRSWK_05661 [Rhodopirellula sp. SWK7]